MLLKGTNIYRTLNPTNFSSRPALCTKSYLFVIFSRTSELFSSGCQSRYFTIRGRIFPSFGFVFRRS